jgi:hypothetical protein
VIVDVRTKRIPIAPVLRELRLALRGRRIGVTIRRRARGIAFPGVIDDEGDLAWTALASGSRPGEGGTASSSALRSGHPEPAKTTPRAVAVALNRCG